MATSKTAVYAAIIGNLAIAVMKGAAAALTGSSAMLSEGIHSLVDTGNGGLLLLGIRLSQKPPDDAHPFGHGKELYFWSLIVAVTIFGVGGGISIYEGILHLLHPQQLEDPTWSYVVLGLAVVFEGIVLYVALKHFLAVKGDQGVWQSALLGLVVAFAGIYLAHRLENPYLDGLASVAIGCILCAVAGFLAYESKSLLVGEGADPLTLQRVSALAEADPAVERIERPLTMHFGPDTVLLTLNVRFRASVSAAEAEAAVLRLEHAIQAEHPEIKHIFIEARSLGTRGRAPAPGSA